MTINTDFNTAETYGYEVISANTIAEAILNIKPGGYIGSLTKNERTSSIGLNVEFTITGGKYKGRKIFQLIGVEGSKKDDQGLDKWGMMGKKLIRSIFESAKGISSKDMSDKAVAARKIEYYADLNGLSCLVKISVEKDKTGQYGDRNRVTQAVTIDSKEYSQFQEGAFQARQNNIAPGSSLMKDSLDDEIPF